MLKALQILKEELEELRNRKCQIYSYIREKKESLKEAIAELEALETKDTQSMTREEARKLIDKHSKKDEFGMGVVSKKVAYIIADYLPKDKK